MCPTPRDVCASSCVPGVIGCAQPLGIMELMNCVVPYRKGAMVEMLLWGGLGCVHPQRCSPQRQVWSVTCLCVNSWRLRLQTRMSECEDALSKEGKCVRTRNYMIRIRFCLELGIGLGITLFYNLLVWGWVEQIPFWVHELSLVPTWFLLSVHGSEFFSFPFRSKHRICIGQNKSSGRECGICTSCNSSQSKPTLIVTGIESSMRHSQTTFVSLSPSQIQRQLNRL